MSDAVDIDM